MLSFLSSPKKRIEGKIKSIPEDFIVEEITEKGDVLEVNKKIEKEGNGDYLRAVVQKRNWTTIDALRKIAKTLKVSYKRIGFAGNKDRNALTTQLISIYGIRKEEMERIKIKDIEILGSWYSNEPVKLGDLLGNRFTVKIREVKGWEEVRGIAEELNNLFPNYFGEQRFGGGRTHLIGEQIVKNNLEEAVFLYLTESKKNGNIEEKNARERLKKEMDYEMALRYFPKHLRLERLVLQHLAKKPNDYANALRKLPRQLLMLFIHSFQSHLFNIMLSERIEEGGLEKEEHEYYCGFKGKFPDLELKVEKGLLVGKVIGYETELSKREKEILERFYIRKEDFRIRTMPELASKGTFRLLLSPAIDLTIDDEKKSFRFILPKGSYATSLLREFLKGVEND